MSRPPLLAAAAALSPIVIVAAGLSAPAAVAAPTVVPSAPITAAALSLNVSPKPAAAGHTMRVVVRTQPRKAGQTVDLRLHQGGKVVTVQQARTNRDGKAELRIPGRYVTKKGYRFTVTSNGAPSVSFRSNADKRLTAVGVAPAPPRGINIEPGDGALFVSWRPVPGATEYRGVLIQGTTTTYGPWITDTEWAFTGLTNDAVYSAGAQARNAAGEISSASTDSNATPTADAPGPVPGLAATVDKEQVTLVWNDAPRADEYVIKYKVAGTSFAFMPHSSISNNSVNPDTTTIKGLTDGVKYEFQVYGVNDFGRGISSVVDATPEDNKPEPGPAPVESLSLVPGDAKITANWTVTASDAANFILYTSTDGQQWTENQTVAGTARTATIAGLTNGQAYWVQIVAVNGTGGSAPKVSGPVFPVGKPSATPNLRAVPSDNSIILDWAPMTGVTKFRITYRPTTATTWAPYEYVDAPGLNYVVDALEEDIGYFVKMAAVNGAGVGPEVTLGPLVPSSQVPDRVTNGTVTPGTGQAVLNWDAAPGATGYKVEAKRVGVGEDDAVAATVKVAAAGQVNYTIPGLASGEKYTFTIYAINSYGYSRGAVVGPVTIN